MLSTWVAQRIETETRCQRAPRRVEGRRPPFRGFLARLGTAFFLCSASYVAWVFISPQIEVYRAKSLVRNACTQAMRETVATGTHPDWEEAFVERLDALQLESDSVEYSVEPSDPCVEDDCICEGRATFEILTPWPFLSRVLQSVPPRLSHHRVSVHVTYR